MKKYLTLILTAFVLTACTEQQLNDCYYTDTCNKAYQYVVSEPVEVTYKNIVYTTVYEPKTYKTTNYTKYRYCN